MLCRWISNSQFILHPEGGSPTVFQNAEKGYPSTQRNIPKDELLRNSVIRLYAQPLSLPAVSEHDRLPPCQVLGW